MPPETKREVKPPVGLTERTNQDVKSAKAQPLPWKNMKSEPEPDAKPSLPAMKSEERVEEKYVKRGVMVMKKEPLRIKQEAIAIKREPTRVKREPMDSPSPSNVPMKDEFNEKSP